MDDQARCILKGLHVITNERRVAAIREEIIQEAATKDENNINQSSFRAH